MSSTLSAVRSVGPANLLTAGLLVGGFLVPAAFGQDFHSTSIPTFDVLDCYVTDSGTDTVWRLADLDLDGDYQDAGEVTAFYDEDLGTLALGNNNSVAIDPRGIVFVSDTSSDQIIALVDLDGDGTAHSIGEHTVFFDGDPTINADGIAMESPANVTCLRDGRLLVADANNGSGGADQILILEDVNGDGDANDAGEVTVFLIHPGFGSVADYIPNAVDVLPDGDLLYSEGSSNGTLPKGLWRLSDANGDGVIDPSTELSVYFIPPILGATEFMWDFGVDVDGTVYVADTGNDVIWKMLDVNGDGGIDNSLELIQYWTAPGSSLIWTVQPDGEGRLLVAESQAPDRVVLMEDLDGSGFIDQPNEERVVWSEDVSPTNISNPRGLTWRRAPLLRARPRAEIGRDLTYFVRGTAAEPFVLVASVGPVAAPVTIPPYGVLEIDLANGFVAAAGTLDANGRAIDAFRIANDPSLSGRALHLQALVGPIPRRALTDKVVVAIN